MPPPCLASGTGLVVLGLGVLSPFILFQAGSFLSHPIAAGMLAGALAAFVAAETRNQVRYYALAGGLLGAAFLTREASSVLFALPLLARLLAKRRVQGLGWLVACGLPFALLYFGYNAVLTGSPVPLPRTLFDPSDLFGFGDGYGFHRRHTPAAGLVNTDELLTLLQFDLFGWLPLASFGLIAVPFLFGRARGWDFVAGGGVLCFVVAYAAYFYHGVALGPRYYFEAMPWLLLLAGRGAQVLAHLTGSRAAVVALLGLLSLNTLLFYVPTQAERRSEFAGLPDGRRATLGFVRPSLLGPQLINVPTPALVLTGDWWVFNAMLSALNCADLDTCPVVFAFAPGEVEAQRVLAEFPGRMHFRAVDRDGRIDIEPDVAHNR